MTIKEDKHCLHHRSRHTISWFLRRDTLSLERRESGLIATGDDIAGEGNSRSSHKPHRYYRYFPQSWCARMHPGFVVRMEVEEQPY